MKKILFISLLVAILPVLSVSATASVVPVNTINVKFDKEKITMTDNEDIATINLKTRGVMLNNKVVTKNYKYDISDSFIRETLKNKDGKIIFDIASIITSISDNNTTNAPVVIGNKTDDTITFDSCVGKVYDIYSYIVSDEYTNTSSQQEEVIARILEVEDILDYKEVVGYSNDDKSKAFNMMVSTLRNVAADKGTKIYSYYIKEFEGYNSKFKESYNK